MTAQTSLTLWTLAYQDGPPTAESGGTTAQPGGNGGPGAGPAGGGGGAFGTDLLLILFVVVMAMIVFSLFGQRRERKKREAMMSSLKKHDQVQTVGGIIGSIVEVKGDRVVLKVDESSNTRMTMSRSAIQQVLSEDANKSS